MIKILIVDDEPAAGNILQLLIGKYLEEEHEIVCYQQPEEAIAAIGIFKPSLVMLDIEMPAMNGFDLLNKIGYWDFDLIFTTAYDQYAIKAIRFSAMDYLLKPIDIIELQNALNKHVIRTRKKDDEQKQLMNNLIGNLKRQDNSQFKLALSTMEGLFFYLPSQIIRLEGESNYTRFYFTNQKPMLVSRTLKEYDEILRDYNFVRVHKSHLVNKQFVKQMDKDGVIWMKDGSQIGVSRRKKDEVIRKFKEN